MGLTRFTGLTVSNPTYVSRYTTACGITTSGGRSKLKRPHQPQHLQLLISSLWRLYCMGFARFIFNLVQQEEPDSGDLNNILIQVNWQNSEMARQYTEAHRNNGLLICHLPHLLILNLEQIKLVGLDHRTTCCDFWF